MTSKATPLRLPLGDGAGANQHELQIEQLVEGEPAPAPFRLGRGGGTVHRAERLGQRGQPERRRSALGEDVGEQRDQRIEMPVDQRPRMIL